MCRTKDTRYAETLLRMARTDASRATSDPTRDVRRCVALWMADELVRCSSLLDVAPDVSATMRDTARAIRSQFRATPTVA